MQQGQGAIAAQALLHQKINGGGIQGPTAPRRRQADGIAQTRLRQGRHEDALGLDQLVQGRIGLGGAEKIAAQGHHHRHLAGWVRRRPEQIGQKRLAGGRLRAEAVELLQLVHHHHQGPHIGFRQLSGDPLQAVEGAAAIGQGQLLRKFACFAHGH